MERRSHEEVMFYDVLIEYQAKLFELSSENGYASEDFIRTFMYSDYAANLYCEGGWSTYNFDFYTLQMEIIEDDYGVTTEGPVWEEDLMYWIGFIYRYWYFYTGDSAVKIYETAPPAKMRDMYISYANENPDYIVDVLLGRDPWEPPEVEEDWKNIY